MDALKFLDGLVVFVPVFLEDGRNDEDVQAAIKRISLKMRSKLSRPVIFSALQMIMRLAEFAMESKKALDEERTPSFPEVSSHVDYTIRVIWIKWAEEIAKEQDDEWKDTSINPYEDIWNALDNLSMRIWKKHFFIKL